MDLLPIRMLNEIAYCPRLFALEHVRGDFADNEHTIEGRAIHARVDRSTRATLPEPDEDTARPRSVRRVHLSDAALGMVGILDLVEVDGGAVVPVDYKKGRAPAVPEGAWEPERVQVCAQVLLLRAHGYRVDHGVLYFAGSKRRVRVDANDTLIAATLHYRDLGRQLLGGIALPPPLVDSPKCRGCSLTTLCLPDEQALLSGQDKPVQRELVPARDDTIPLHVTLYGGRAGLSGGEIVVKDRTGKEEARVRIAETSQVVLHGNITVTTPLMHALAKRDIPVAFHSHGGWYHGTFHPASGRNVQVRHAQHLAAANPDVALAFAKDFIVAKIHNQRVMLRRNARGLDRSVLNHLADAIEQVPRAPDPDTLRGIEGMAARRYFEAFPLMLRGELSTSFQMDGRNRRPPRDPVNALLSFAYAMLARAIAQVCHQVGLDPYVGFLHTIRPGRPALALDLMEEFRPVLCDSAVLNAINNGVIQSRDVDVSPVGCRLRDAARKRFVQVVERRVDELVTHPTFGTRWSYRRVLEVQARLLGRVLTSELKRYPGFRVR